MRQGNPLEITRAPKSLAAMPWLLMPAVIPVTAHGAIPCENPLDLDRFDFVVFSEDGDLPINLPPGVLAMADFMACWKTMKFDTKNHEIVNANLWDTI